MPNRTTLGFDRLCAQCEAEGNIYQRELATAQVLCRLPARLRHEIAADIYRRERRRRELLEEEEAKDKAS